MPVNPNDYANQYDSSRKPKKNNPAAGFQTGESQQRGITQSGAKIQTLLAQNPVRPPSFKGEMISPFNPNPQVQVGPLAKIGNYTLPPYQNQTFKNQNMQFSNPNAKLSPQNGFNPSFQGGAWTNPWEMSNPWTILNNPFSTPAQINKAKMMISSPNFQQLPADVHEGGQIVPHARWEQPVGPSGETDGRRGMTSIDLSGLDLSIPPGAFQIGGGGYYNGGGGGGSDWWGNGGGGGGGGGGNYWPQFISALARWNIE